jgi:signal transduction histidine kinase
MTPKDGSGSTRGVEAGPPEPASTGSFAGLSRRVGEASRLNWRALSRSGRIAIAGIVASALLAVSLGVVIPRVVEGHVLEARLEAVSALVRVLEDGHLIPPTDEHLSGESLDRFDSVVRGGLLGGDNVRVKLWNQDGEVVYSDNETQVGQTFPIESHLRSALSGRPTVEESDLSADENRDDTDIGPKLLEFYLPLRDEQGTVIGAFEVYQDVGTLASHLSDVRWTVWIAVGIGLAILTAFLVLLFGGTAAAMARDERAAQERAEDLAMLLGTSRALSSDLQFERTGVDVLSALTDRLGLRCSVLVTGVSSQAITFADDGEEGACAVALEAARDAAQAGRESSRTGDVRLAQGKGDWVTYSALAVPLVVGPGLTGALAACRETERPFDERERVLVGGVASQLGVAAVNSRLFSDLETMTRARGEALSRLVNAQEEERRHLVGDLHDGFGQIMTRILYGLRGSQTRLGTEPEKVADELARLETLADMQSRDLRRYMATIRPALLEEFGLHSAIEAFAREQEAESGLAIGVDVVQIPEPAQAEGIILFRAVQEAVINARKHADAHRVWIRLTQRDGAIVLEVEDDGRGTDALRDGIGLTYMRDRVSSLGGKVSVESVVGHGTTITVMVPIGGTHGSR